MKDTSQALPTATIQTLRSRARILARVRSFLAARNYWEVETPILGRDRNLEAHIEPIEIELERGRPNYLQTSPEFAMKRLLASGSESIYQITKAFRRSESGPRHNPEFTIVEWYRVGASYRDLMREVASLVGEITGIEQVEEICYRDAFRQLAGLDPFAASHEQLRHEAAADGLAVNGNVNRDDLLNFLLASRVEPALGIGCQTFLYDYPGSQAALAQVTDSQPPIGQRFELYIQGIELCNGYQELRDSEVLKARIEGWNHSRRAQGDREFPTDSGLAAALQIGLPRCAGVAMGFDRLVMVALGKCAISEVIAFPFERA